MDEVQLEVEALARKQMLARVMEMKLQQLVELAVDRRIVTGRAVHLNGVPVVQYCQGRFLEGWTDRAGLRPDRALQIDRRLFHAEVADPEIRLQAAPVLGSAFALRGPMRLMRRRRLARYLRRMRAVGRESRADRAGRGNTAGQRLQYSASWKIVSN